VNPQLQVVLLALSWSGVVGACGLVLVRVGGTRSVRASLVAVAVAGLVAVVAGVVGTARAMFLSGHDLGVVVLVSLVSGAVGVLVALSLAGRVTADVRTLVRAATAVERAAGAGSDAPPPLDDLPGPRTAEFRLVREELAAAARRLADAQRRERALEASRRELVAWVSHDLRTPLAGIRAMAEALEDGVADDEARYHRQIRREVDHLSRLVDDLFELSRIQSGSLRLRLDRLDAAALAGDVVAGVSPVGQARGVRLRASLAPGRLEADGASLGRVLANLVVNAVRHTPSGGTVEVSTAAERGLGGDVVVLAVSDGCGGIPAEDLERVFEPGWRGSTARSPQSDAEADAGVGGGGGLGLAIARGIVDAHGGGISVRNTGPGCRFEVRLPAAGPPP